MRRLWLAVVLVAIGCADEIPEDVSAEMEAAREANRPAADTVSGPAPEELIVTAPAGGHADWIRDIRTGLDTVPAEAALDRGAALHSVQELYSRRFEPLRLFYGAGGALAGDARLTRAVENAGTHLQELMRHLAGNEANAALIDEVVRASQNALDEIEAAARAAGLPPTAPRDMITTNS